MKRQQKDLTLLELCALEYVKAVKENVNNIITIRKAEFALLTAAVEFTDNLS